MTDFPQIFLHEKIEDYDRFEHLLLEVSTSFINLPIEEIDSTIEQTQQSICDGLNIDLSALWQWSDSDAGLLTITHLYGPEDGPDPGENIDGPLLFPYVYQKMLDGETVAFSNDDLPEEAQVDKASRESFNVISSICVPLVKAGTPILGLLSFDMLGKKRIWQSSEIRRLKIVAEIFTSALLRKKNIKALKESEAKVTLAAESTEAGLWELDYLSGNVWASAQNRKMFGFPSNEQVTLEHFRRVVYPKDWPHIEQAIKESFENNTKLKVEYRISNSMGELRWINSMGSPQLDIDGLPKRLLGISFDVSERKQMEQELKRQFIELRELKDQIEQENIYLREELIAEQGFEDVIGRSNCFLKVLKNARNVSPTPATVLLQGETGTGKGIIANLIHRLSERNNKPLVTVNCAALPHSLIENELFGRAKGAFTGADASQAGRFEVANKGTIFLDEIGEMALDIQAKLLRILQEGEFERLGSSKTMKVDVRVIAATSRNLKKDVEDGLFREDLFYRLNVFPITIPPLRERVEDIPLLAKYFVNKYNKKMRKSIKTIPKITLKQMRGYPWPGNIRELEHLIERSIILSEGPSLSINKEFFNIGSSVSSFSVKVQNLATNEREHILSVLIMTNWKIEGQDGAATILDIHPSTLRFRMKKLDLKRPRLSQ